MGKANPIGSASKSGTQQSNDPLAMVKQEAAKEQEKLNSLKRQDNVETSKDDSNIVTLGVDEYDRWVKEYFQLPNAPGYTPNYSREDFPTVNGDTITVSRCYFNKVDGKFVVLDILDKGEYTDAQLDQIQATMRALGFQYTWTYRDESTTLADIFDARMMKKNNISPNVKKLVQTNVTTVKA